MRQGIRTLGWLSVVCVACSSASSATSPDAVTTIDNTGGGVEVPGTTLLPRPSPTDAGAVIDASDGGSASECVPGPVPAAVRAQFGLAPFYTQYVDYLGFPIVASSKPAPRALCVARDVISHMFASRPELVGRLVEKKIRLAIMGKTELTTDIPEHSDLTPKAYWDERARGLGATLARPAVSAAEENVLCDTGDRYRGESILVHEFSHAIFNMAVDLYEPALKSELDADFAAAIAAHKFDNTYAATNRDEYWAEGAQDWFDTNATAIPSNGIHNDIHTRAQLVTYDPALSTLMRKVFGDLTWRYACPAPITTSH